MVLTLQKIYQDTNKCRKSRKQNKYQNKRQIPYGDNRRPSNCITEEYLQSDKHVEISKKKKGYYKLIEIMQSSLHLGKNTHCWGQLLKVN